MVDEYQDTNAAQFQLVHALTREHRNLCVVGDDDQSIYGWRGAEIANLLDMEKHFPEVKVIKLEQNYRSTNTILNAANAIIKNNVRRRGKQLWSQKGDGPKISLHTFADRRGRGARASSSRSNYARLAHRMPWSEQAILFRTNLQSRPLETALRQAGVRYHLIGGQSFFDRREIRDFLAYLKMFLNPHDDISLLRIANVPARGLSDVTMERLLGASHERKVLRLCRDEESAGDDDVPGQDAQEHRGVRGICRTDPRGVEGVGCPETGEDRPASPGTGHSQLSPGPTISWTRPVTSPNCAASEKNPEDRREPRPQSEGIDGDAGRDRRRPIQPLERLENFLENITLDTEREEEEERTGDAVTLITMHSCKGLEFPHVFIVGLEDGLLPHSRSKAEGTLDEERRLFYVAVTRAMQTLTISHCGGRKKYGQVLPCHPSPFLKELPPELVEHADAKGGQPVAADAGKDHFDILRAALE